MLTSAFILSSTSGLFPKWGCAYQSQKPYDVELHELNLLVQVLVELLEPHFGLELVEDLVLPQRSRR